MTKEPPPYSQTDQPLAEENGLQIRLQQATFDPLQGLPPQPPQLTAVTTISPSTNNYYLVQFEGPILAEWRADLERQGAVIMDYVPDFAYIVRMDGRSLTQLQTTSPIRWIGLYQPVFRLSNDLIAGLATANPDATAELIVRAFSGESADVLNKQMTDLGGVVVEQYADSGGGAIFKLQIAETAVADLAHIPAIAWIEPQLEVQLANEIARSNAIMGKDQVETALGLFGAGQMVAVGDTGLDTGNAATAHQDFNGRIVGGTWGPGDCGTWADNHSHGTHVAGSVLGSGVLSGADIPNQIYSGSNAGIAPEALLYVWSFCNNFSGLPDAPYADYYGVLYGVDSRLRVNTNSWGYTTNQGEYNTFTRETDRFIWDNPDMILTYAAGNEGTDANSNGVVDLGSINMPSTAKNVITVGASENYRLTGGYNPGGACSTWGGCWSTDYPANPINSDRLSDNVNGMAAFSSRGPTLSGRLKPDVVAPGSNIVSTRNYSTGTGWGVYDANYLYMGGTSMATPLVAGATAVVREYYTTTHSINPTAALVKATLINGAFDMSPGQYGAGATQDVTRRADNNQGWGRVDLVNSLIYSGDDKLWFHEDAGLNTNGRYQIYLDVTNTAIPLRATLVWVDQPGLEATYGALINDLDLEIIAPNGTHYYGNDIFDGTLDSDLDRTNNVEGIDLTPMSGTYTVIVHGYNVPSGPQPFALVVTGDVTPTTLGYLTGVVDDGSTPIVGATVSATGPFPNATTTDSNGIYTMVFPAGSYDGTASAYGYNPSTVTGIAITAGVTTTQNFSLVAAPSYTVSGIVTDAATGWPLYASLNIDGYPSNPVWTDPVTGYYSVTLPGGSALDFTASAWVAGYNDENRVVGPLVGNTTENFALDADPIACNAPGYSLVGQYVHEGFEGVTFPPTGWARFRGTNGLGIFQDWLRTTTNPYAGTAAAFVRWENVTGGLAQDWLVTPLVQPTSAGPTVQFYMRQSFAINYGTSYTVRVSTASQTTHGDFTTIQTYSETDFGTTYQPFSVDLSDYIGQDIYIAFVMEQDDGDDWYLDEIRAGGTTCTPPTGGLVVGNVYDALTSNGINGATVTNEDGFNTVSATAAGPAGDGFYTLYSPAGSKQFTASAMNYLDDITTPTVVAGSTIRQDFYLTTPPPSSGYTVCTTPNLAIPDNNSTGVNSTLTFTEVGYITDVNLYLRGPHTFVGDLIFTLQHPSGAPTVTAVDRPGYSGTGAGCVNYNFDLWLDDAGTDGPVENQCSATPPALFGRATPNNPLSAFNDLPANGTWTLNVSDRAGADTGTLQEWCVEISLVSDFIWRGAQNSNWNNINNWLSGALPGAGDNVILDPTYLTGANAWPVLEVDPTVNDLTVEAGAELTIPHGRSLTVNGALTNNGTLRQIIDNVAAPTTFLGMGGYGGVEIDPAGNMGNTTVEIRGNQACTNNPTSQHVQRCFDIAPTTDQSATIRFYYLPGEANGNPEAGVSVYHWNGASWGLEAGTHSHSSGADPRWVQVTGVSDYSPFVLDNVTPTAVTLQSFSANPGTSITLVGLGFILLLAAGAWLAIRRR